MDTVVKTVGDIHLSRKHLLDMLDYRGYDISAYREYTFSDITLMFNSYDSTKELPNPGSLDIIAKKKNSDGKNGDNIFVKYYLEKFRQSSKLDKLIDEIMTTTIGKNDTLILIITGRVLLKSPNKIMDYVNYWYSSKKNYFIQFYGVDNFKFNPIDHIAIPKHEKLKKDEVKELLTKYSIILKDLPHIRREDPPAKYIGMRPNDVCKITRKNEISGVDISYRICTPT